MFNEPFSKHVQRGHSKVDLRLQFKSKNFYNVQNIGSPITLEKLRSATSLRLDFLIFTVRMRKPRDLRGKMGILMITGLRDWKTTRIKRSRKIHATLYTSSYRPEKSMPARICPDVGASNFASSLALSASFCGTHKLSRAMAVYSLRAYKRISHFLARTLISSTSMSFDCDFRNTDIQYGSLSLSLSRDCSRPPIIPLYAIRPTQRRDAVFYERKSRRKEWGAKRS